MPGKTLIAAAALALSAAAPADAACTLANIAGSWAAYPASVKNSLFFWFECGLAVNAAGKITAGSCAISTDGTVSPVTGSVHLTVPANCVYTAVIDFTNPGTILTVNHATLSLDKQTVLGVASAGPEKFIFNMVKVK